MKKLFYLCFVVIVLLATGCKNDDVSPVKQIHLELSHDNISINAGGGSASVTVYCNDSWEVYGSCDWCSPSLRSGMANDEDGTVVNFDAKESYAPREAIFYFMCGEICLELKVTQEQKNVIFADEQNIFNIPASGGVALIEYKTNVLCGVVIPTEAEDWISLTSTRALRDESMGLYIAPNETYDSRSATIMIVAIGDSTLCAEYTINQAQKDVILAGEDNKFIVSSDGGDVNIDFETNVNYKVNIPSNARDWITLVEPTRGVSPHNIVLRVAKNKTYDKRSAVISITKSGASNPTVEYTINQEQNDAILPDENNTFTVPSAGGEVAINYQTNIDCEVIIPEEAQSWITIAPATRGLVSESITLNVAENTTYSARTAVVKVVAKDNAELAVEYTINQEQRNGVLVDGNNTFNVSATGGSVVIKHQANVDCDVIIPEEAQDWITIAPSTRGLSTYSTTLNIAENNSGKERSCVVKVVSQDDNELSAEYTIIQNTKCFLYYTSSNGKIVTPNNSSAFDATILSNTYIDGVGVIEFDGDVTTIGNSAFSGCDSLTSVTIPDSVTTIERSAFSRCSSLTSATIPDSVTTIENSAFWYCSSLTSVIIPDSVTWIGESAFSGCSSLTSVTIPDSVTTIGYEAFRNCNSLTSVIIPDSVTTIGRYAFYGCSSLTSVTIPDSVTTIRDQAFYGCSSLESVTIPDSVTSIEKEAFYGCSSLESVTIGNGVTSIDESTFSSCSSLASVTIGDSVTSIGNSAFYSCSSLKSVTIPDSVTTIGSSAFYGCSSLTSATIPDSVTTIGKEAFYGCTGELIIYSKIIETDYIDNNYPPCYGWLKGAKFTKLTIGDSVTKIGGFAFWDCDSLTSVTIGNGVTTIGENAFSRCSSLTSVTIPDSVTTIGNEAFYNCSSLESVTIGDSVTTIGNHTFYDCSSLTSVTIPDSVTSIGYYAFYGCSSLTSVTIGDSVTTIGQFAFFNCTGELVVNCNIPSALSSSSGAFYGSKFTSVTIGDSVTSIGYNAFYGCSSLTSVTIGNSVTTIGEDAFYGCSSLTSVTIPDSVTTIGDSAFDDCRSLTSVFCKATTPPSLGEKVFKYYIGSGFYYKIGCDIYVPTESVEAYKSAEGWSEYASDIEGYYF